RFTTWLYRVVLNLAFDRMRRPSHASIDEAAEMRSMEPEPERLMIEHEERRTVAAAMAALPERQRAAIALFYMEGLRGREAAQSLNVSEKAFESLLVRARSALKQFIERREQTRRRFA